MIHPQTRYERLKLREQKTKEFPKDRTGHIRKRVAKELLKEREAEDEINQSTRLGVTG